MSPTVPRLLVATEFPPNAAGGGPAVIRQMLKDWPAAKICWWSCFPETNEVFDFKVSDHRVANIPKKLYPRIRLTTLKTGLLEMAWKPWATRHLRAAISELNPDVVWAIPHQWSIPALARTLPGSSRGFHVTVQDYPDGLRNIAAFGEKTCRQMMAAVSDLYRTATTRDATSHPMIDDLRERTGQEAAQMLHAGLETEQFRQLETKISSPSDIVRIAYAGTIILPDVFALFVAAVRELREELMRPIELHLFSAHTYRTQTWFDPAWMHEHGNLPEKLLVRELQACTWGLSLMDLEDDDPQYNRFSFPTKFITYLSAGLPVITIGHPESSVAKMANKYGTGVYSPASTREELTSALRNAFKQAAPGDSYADAIRNCARTEFDADRMRSVLFSCFEKCAGITRARLQQ